MGLADAHKTMERIDFSKLIRRWTHTKRSQQLAFLSEIAHSHLFRRMMWANEHMAYLHEFQKLRVNIKDTRCR